MPSRRPFDRIDQRLLEPGLSWINIGRFFIISAIANAIFRTFFGYFYTYAVLSGGRPDIIVIATYIVPILITAAALWFAVRPNAEQMGVFSSLALRRSSLRWYAISMTALVTVIGILFLLSSIDQRPAGGLRGIAALPEIPKILREMPANKLIAILTSTLQTSLYQILSFGVVFPALLNSASRFTAVTLTALLIVAQTTTLLFATLSFASIAIMLLLAVTTNVFFCFLTARSGSALPAVLATTIIQFLMTTLQMV